MSGFEYVKGHVRDWTKDNPPSAQLRPQRVARDDQRTVQMTAQRLWNYCCVVNKGPTRGNIYNGVVDKEGYPVPLRPIITPRSSSSLDSL